MKIKTKLRLGFGFLFAIVMAFGAMGIYYINRISESSKVILKDNYETLRYTRAMEEILNKNSIPLRGRARESFDKNFRLEYQNITEKGEQEEVLALKEQIDSLNAPTLSAADRQKALTAVREHLLAIEDLNMQAIVRKNNIAQESVSKATAYLGLVGSFTFLILFSFVINFPGYVANPIREFAEGIRQISRRNYKQRLDFRTNDEFAELAASFNEMAARLDEWENSSLAKIKSEKLRIEAIIENMQDPIVGLNEKSEVLFINKAAEDILNLDENQIVGQNALEIAGTNDLLRTILNEGANDKPLKIFANGKESYFRLESRAIDVPADLNADNEQPFRVTSLSAGTVYILRNITEFKELDEAKTNFIATISHELKTPISSIKMSLKLLKDERVGSLNHEQDELVLHIKEDTDRLLKITTELLDLSQVETGNIQLQLKRTHPLEIVRYAMEAMQFQAEQKNVQLELISRQTLPDIQIDTEKTAWVLINFLSNALRYSSERSRILVQVNHNGNEIEFSVKDFGKGIEERYLNRLFERYFQVPADGQNKSGSGLGLAISKDFIEAQNGRIWVESALGEGSRFSFAIPVAPPAEA